MGLLTRHGLAGQIESVDRLCGLGWRDNWPTQLLLSALSHQQQCLPTAFALSAKHSRIAHSFKRNC